MHQNHREDVRNARAANNNRDHFDQREQRMPVGNNSSGKKNAYMSWLRQEGRRRYLNTYGSTYDDKDPNAKARMSEFYENLPPEIKAKYKHDAKEANSNPQIYLAVRKQKNRERRMIQHNNPELHEKAEREHKEQLKEQQKVGLNAVPLNMNIPDIHVEGDLNAFCRQNAQTARTVLKSIMCTVRGPGEEIALWDPVHEYQFVSISPLIYTYKLKFNRLSVYPAEISITKFHLKTGLQETESRFVEYVPEWFHGMEPEDAATARNRRNNAQWSGIPEDGMTADNAMAPDVAMGWLREKLSQCKTRRILCDKNAYNFVFYGIKLLVRYTGHNAVHIFKTTIMNQLVSIQDFTEILLEEAPLLIPPSERWTREMIDEAFKFKDLVPCSDQDRICPTHAAMHSSQKMNCTGAHSARILQNFFYILRKNFLADIYNYCDGPAHRPCQVMETEISDLFFVARTITREDEVRYTTRGNPTAVQYEPRYPTSSNVPAPVCDEPIYLPTQAPLSNDEDVDDEEDDDVYQYNPVVNYDPYNPSTSEAPSTSAPIPTPNLDRYYGPRTDDFISSEGRVDPDSISHRRGVRDLNTEEEYRSQQAPTTEAPTTAVERNIVATANSTYLPFAINPVSGSVEMPRLDFIINNCETYFRAMRSVNDDNPRVYKPIRLSCLD